MDPVAASVAAPDRCGRRWRSILVLLAMTAWAGPAVAQPAAGKARGPEEGAVVERLQVLRPTPLRAVPAADGAVQTGLAAGATVERLAGERISGYLPVRAGDQAGWAWWGNLSRAGGEPLLEERPPRGPDLAGFEPAAGGRSNEKRFPFVAATRKPAP